MRRVERQHAILERLVAAPGPVTAPRLARELGVSERTIVRDVRRLRESGVPLIVRAGRYGGLSLNPVGVIPAIAFDLAELAALVATLAALGPTATEAAASAMRKLTQAMTSSGENTSLPDHRPRESW